MAERARTQGGPTPPHSGTPPQRDQITTTEGPRVVGVVDNPSKPASEYTDTELVESYRQDLEQAAQPPTADLTIIEPEPSPSDTTVDTTTVDTMRQSLEQITLLSRELPSSDYLAKVLVSVHAALVDLDTLKLHLQGFEVS